MGSAMVVRRNDSKNENIINTGAGSAPRNLWRLIGVHALARRRRRWAVLPSPLSSEDLPYHPNFKVIRCAGDHP